MSRVEENKELMDVLGKLASLLGNLGADATDSYTISRRKRVGERNQMQIVIDIDENLYTRLFDNGDVDAVDMLKACVAIRKGTPLPKGHGELKDVDALDDVIMQMNENGAQITRYEYKVIDNVLFEMPTIIEADAVEESVE